jgi:hypothetical protein
LIWFYIVVFYSPTTKVGVLVRQRVPVSGFSAGRESSPRFPRLFSSCAPISRRARKFPRGFPAVPPWFPPPIPACRKEREEREREREREEREEREERRDKRQETREKREGTRERERDRLEKKEGRRE